MRLKHGYTYTARLSGSELEIIKKGLEALLDCYIDGEINEDSAEYFKSTQTQEEVEKLKYQIDESVCE